MCHPQFWEAAANLARLTSLVPIAALRCLQFRFGLWNSKVDHVLSFNLAKGFARAADKVIFAWPD